MSGLDDWLAGASRQRRRAGLRRSLAARGPWLSTAAPLDLAGNDYLGLATDPRVVAAAAEAAQAWGAGAGSSRLVTGTLHLHDRLERRLADALGHASALVLSTGYHANLAAVTALADADTLIVSDAHVHASLVDGCRLARGEVRVVPHLDVAAVAAALSGRTQPRALVLTESVFSVLGDAAPLADLAAVCARHDATLLVDEAHAVGVAGAAGLGLVAAQGPSGAEVVVTLTLSKALGSQGGAVLGSSAVVEHLVNTARPFIFDTGLAPPAAGAALAALDVLLAEPSLAGRVRARAAELAAGCRVPATCGAIVPVPMPGPEQALAAQEQARGRDVVVGCFRPPSVPDGVSRLRLTARATLTDARAGPRRSGARGRAQARGSDVVTARFRLITGTDTGVGKTVATAALACRSAAAGELVLAVKPVQTGLAPGQAGDADEVRRLSGVETHELVRLPEPLAPESAAYRSGHDLPSAAELARRAAAVLGERADGTVLVEGAGGVAVRLDSDGSTLLDVGTALAAYGAVDVVLVVRSGLGSLNHTELSVEAIRRSGLEPAGLVIGSWPAAPGLADRVNATDLTRLTGLPLLAVLPAGAAALEPAVFRARVPDWVP